MDLGRTRRIELLAERPPLTGTRWPPWSSTSPNCTRSSRRGGSKSRSGSSTSRTSSCWLAPGSGNSGLRAGVVHPARRAYECATSTRAENGMSGSEDHGRFRELFDELSAAVEARGVRGHVYLVGGAPAAATSTSSSSAA